MNRLHTLEAALALTLIHSLWMVGLLALLAALSLALAARRSAALRHALGMGFLLAMVLVPFVFFDQLLAGSDLAMPTPVRGTAGPTFSVAPYVGLPGGGRAPGPAPLVPLGVGGGGPPHGDAADRRVVGASEAGPAAVRAAA